MYSRIIRGALSSSNTSSVLTPADKERWMDGMNDTHTHTRTHTHKPTTVTLAAHDIFNGNNFRSSTKVLGKNHEA